MIAYLRSTSNLLVNLSNYSSIWSIDSLIIYNLLHRSIVILYIKATVVVSIRPSVCLAGQGRAAKAAAAGGRATNFF